MDENETTKLQWRAGSANIPISALLINRLRVFTCIEQLAFLTRVSLGKERRSRSARSHAMGGYSPERRRSIGEQLSQLLDPRLINRTHTSEGVLLHTVDLGFLKQIADDLFTPGGWKWRVITERLEYRTIRDGAFTLIVSCQGRVTLEDGTFHEDVGTAKVEGNKDIQQSFLRCCRYAEIDAMKRTLRNFGSVLGNCLYDKEYLAAVDVLVDQL